MRISEDKTIKYAIRNTPDAPRVSSIQHRVSSIAIFLFLLIAASCAPQTTFTDVDYGQCNIPSRNRGFIAITAGEYHSLGLKQDGSIVAWGSNCDRWGNYTGQCNIPSPNSGFIAISAGEYHSLGLKQDSSIVAWGSNYDWYGNYSGQCNIPSPNSGFIAISAGGRHSLAIKKVCQYKLTGDLNDDCRVGWEDVRIFTGQWLDSDGSANLDGFNGINLLDFALLADNWLIDCEIDPNNPACIPK